MKRTSTRLLIAAISAAGFLFGATQQSVALGGVPPRPSINTSVTQNPAVLYADPCSDSMPNTGSSLHWRFIMNFNNGTPNGCLVHPKLFVAQSGAFWGIEKDIIPCSVVGAVTISGGKATFNGGYIKCANFWATGPQDGEVPVSMLDMHVRAQNLGNSSSGKLGNPIFHHPSAAFYLPASGGQAGMSTRHNTRWFETPACAATNGDYHSVFYDSTSTLTHNIGNGAMRCAPSSFSRQTVEFRPWSEPGVYRRLRCVVALIERQHYWPSAVSAQWHARRDRGGSARWLRRLLGNRSKITTHSPLHGGVGCDF